MKMLHIVVYEDKFTPQLIYKLNTYFADKKTFYVLVDKKGRKEFPKELLAYDNVMIYQGIKDFWKLLKIASGARVVVYNALFYRFFLQMQLLACAIFKPKVWIVWSADMYLRDCSNLLKKLYNRFLVSRFAYLATPIEGDFANYQKIWGFGAKNLRFFFPFSQDILKIPLTQKESQITWIQVGNSGHFTNRHLEVLEMLKCYKDKDIKIVIPLSYGCNKDYQQSVESAYREVFGEEKIWILKENLPFVEYVKLLGYIDIGIFHHFVQEAGHNVMLLEAFGKKCYICSQNTLYNMSKVVFNVKVFRTEDLENSPFEEFIAWDSKDSRENMEKMRYFVSDEFFKDEIEKFYDVLQKEIQ